MKKFKVLKIPIPCPICNGSLVMISDQKSLQTMSKANRHVCKDCSFQRSVEKFKKELISV